MQKHVIHVPGLSDTVAGGGFGSIHPLSPIPAPRTFSREKLVKGR